MVRFIFLKDDIESGVVEEQEVILLKILVNSYS